MMTLQDKELLAKKGISEQQIAAQLACFKKGFPYLKLFAAASVENGILAPDTDEQKKYLDAWEAYNNCIYSKYNFGEYIRYNPATNSAEF